MAKPSAQTDFPRTYLIQVYNTAIEHGHLLLHPITEENARSFTQSFYRLRRRSDAAHASFITPEMHLVTVGKWRPENGGTLPIYYSTADVPLPAITPVDLDDEAFARDIGHALDSPHHFVPTLQESAANLEPMDESEINDFVKGLVDKSAQRHKDDES